MECLYLLVVCSDLIVYVVGLLWVCIFRILWLVLHFLFFYWVDFLFSFIDQHISISCCTRVCRIITPKSLIRQLVDIKFSDWAIIKLKPSIRACFYNCIIMATLGRSSMDNNSLQLIIEIFMRLWLRFSLWVFHSDIKILFLI